MLSGKVPLSAQQLSLVAQVLGLRLQRVLTKTAQQDAAVLAAQAVAKHLLPDLTQADRDELVKGVVTGRISDLPPVFDPLLVPVLEEVTDRGHDLPPDLMRALQEQHDAAKGQEILGSTKPARQQRVVMALAQQATLPELRDLIPG